MPKKISDIDLWDKYKECFCNVAETARSLGMEVTSLRKRITRLKELNGLRGDIPTMKVNCDLPDFLKVKGTSQLFKKKPDGSEEMLLSWVKTNQDTEKLAKIMQAAIEAMAEDIPRVQPTPAPEYGNSNLCNCYVITDYHMGLLAWHEEAGHDWDLKLAEDTLIKWFAQAVALSPDAETGVFAQLSDFLHADGLEPLTPASKHVLDVDTRFQKVVRTVIRVLRRIIDILLAKHKFLHIKMADANHDPVSQIWLREWLHAMYENEPRVTVDRSPSPYNAYEFGKVALFFHHGHKRKVTNVSEVFAAQFREMFGRTLHAYAHMGHLHSVDVKENNLMIVEQHRTLAPADAYAARGGWLSGRDAQVITYHKEYGEVSRVKINSDMLK